MPWISVSLSLLLLGVAGVMLDALARDPRGRISTTSARFARWRRLRRLTAGVLLGLIGVLFAIWPAIPEHPKWVLAFTGLMMLSALGMLVMGVWDALATGRHYRRIARKQNTKGLDELHQVVQAHHQNKLAQPLAESIDPPDNS